uniref:Multidrug resistance protein stp n=1 Tax=Actinoallomurus sp. ID145698 TaxID=1820605 RepID=A0A1W5KQ46_9ACTN|nr:multidrug resistance protein stp [Actinoallomurus sp. ID145698]
MTAGEPALSTDSAQTVSRPSPMDAKAWIGLIVILLAAFMELLDVSVVSVAIPAIQRDVDATYAQIQWTLAGYQLAFAAGMITGGRLGDIFGRKRMFITGVFAFVVASLLCGLAPSAGLLVLFRVIQGLAAAAMFPQVLAIMHVSFPEEKRAAVFGAFGAMASLAGIAGPLLGGVLVDANIFGWGWRTIFLINLPVGVIALALAPSLVKESRSSERVKLDLSGALLVTAAVVLLVYPVIQGRDAGWPAWTWISMVASLPVFALFAWWQHARKRGGGTPLVELRLFLQRSFSVGLVVSLLFWTAIASVFLVLTIFLQAGWNYTPLHAGLTFLPLAGASVIGSGIAVPLAPKIGRVVVQIGCLICIAGIVWLMVTVHGQTTSLTTWKLTPSFVVFGIGLGMLIATLNDLILTGVRGDDAGSATGVLNTAGQVAGAVGVAVIGLIFFGQLANRSDEATAAGVPKLRHELQVAGLPAPAIDGVVTGFRTCYHDIAHAKDPTQTPASCRQMSGGTDPQAARIVTGAVNKVRPEVQRRDFIDSLVPSMYYQIAVFAGTFLLVFFLPRRTSGEMHGH